MSYVVFWSCNLDNNNNNNNNNSRFTLTLILSLSNNESEITSERLAIMYEHIHTYEYGGMATLLCGLVSISNDRYAARA